MTTFRVHMSGNFGNIKVFVDADTPEAAAKAARAEYPGYIVTKVKRDKSGNIANLTAPQ